MSLFAVNLIQSSIAKSILAALSVGITTLRKLYATPDKCIMEAIANIASTLVVAGTIEVDSPMPIAVPRVDAAID
jgi:hypothetical protein